MPGLHRQQRGLQNRLPTVLIYIVYLLLLLDVKGDAAKFSDFSFTVEPSDTIAVKDSTAVLNCSASGYPSPVIQWKREGIILDFADDTRRSVLTNGSLYFSNVHHTRTERPDEGVYQCIATIRNIGSIISRSAKLQVASLPKFEEEPGDLTLFPHQTAYFPCLVHAIPQAKITWLRDEQLLQIDPSRMLVLPSGALEIDLLQPSDAGSYKCNASNLEKHRTSSAGVLTVSSYYEEIDRISPPMFIAKPRNTVVTKGANVTLDCVAVGNPRPIITWLKDGTTIDMALLDSRFRKVGVGSLQIENVRENDEGTYMCRAENHEDSLDASASLEVQVAPSFIKKPQNKYAYEKEDAEFECEIYGKPEPTVQWIKDGEAIIQSEYFQIVNGYNLRILGLVQSDKGIYQCVGTNPAGNIQSSAQLITLDPDSPYPTTRASFTTPRPGDQPRSTDVPSSPRNVVAKVVKSRFATLSWTVPEHTRGNILAYSVYYREEGSGRERVLNTTRTRLEEIIIQGLRPATKYYFRIVAYNDRGPGQSSKELVIETDPEVNIVGPPETLKATVLSPTEIFVQWDPPDKSTGTVQHYNLSYVEVGTLEEQKITTTETTYTLKNLKIYTEYSIWVTSSGNGSGQSTEEISTRTFSDAPSDIPQNVTLEAASSSSIIVRWEPPPKEHQNGIITGYKIRYKLKGSRRGETITTDGNRRLYALTGLEKGAQYSVKISALSVNGSGPATEWITAETYQNDLDESKVPDPPGMLKVRPTSTSISVMWAPPKNQNIMIRGYTIGWGIGFPDVYTKVLDGKQRTYTIENLQPSNEYVISLRAYNQIGDGRPIYETVKTLIETTPEPMTPMLPPVGLKAIVLSPTSVVLFWSDSTLPHSQQVITDNRYYIVRYNIHSYPKFKYYNSTNLNCMIDDLKPNTLYEFAVKVVKGRRESTWSMSVLNTTQQSAPSSPPRDLTVVPAEDDPSTISLHWQPPKQQNGQITGYVIFYTTDNTKKDRDWVVEGVVGDRMTTVIKKLTPATTYYFKIQARNEKGYGPLSQEVMFHTAKGLALFTGAPSQGSGLTGNMLYIIIASVLAITVLVIITISIIVCRRRQGYIGRVRKKGYTSGKCTTKGKGGNKDLKPPDLWIHHDQMELKSIDKGQNPDTAMTVTPIPRNSQELADDHVISTLEKKKGSYIDSFSSDESSKTDKPLLPRSIRAKPMMLPLDPQKSSSKISLAPTTSVPNGNVNAHSEGSSTSMPRPLYPRTQYNIPRAHVTIDPAHSGASPEIPSPNILKSQPPMTYEQVLSQAPPGHINVGAGLTGAVGTGQLPSYSSALLAGNPVPSPPPPTAVLPPGDSGTLTKRGPGHPLKSFSVPAPPPQSAPTTPQPKHMVVRPQQVASPHKKTSVGAATSNTPPPTNPSTSAAQATQQPPVAKSRLVVAPRSTQETGTKTNKDDDIAPSYSNEELSQEMANLEGLMKDLNAITASEFEC